MIGIAMTISLPATNNRQCITKESRHDVIYENRLSAV
jgi:hypothetical protein